MTFPVSIIGNARTQYPLEKKRPKAGSVLSGTDLFGLVLAGQAALDNLGKVEGRFDSRPLACQTKKRAWEASGPRGLRPPQVGSPLRLSLFLLT